MCLITNVLYILWWHAQVAGWDFKRVLTSRGANLLATLLLNPKVSDLTGSFRLYKREVLSDLMLCVKGRAYVFQMEVKTYLFYTLCIYISLSVHRNWSFIRISLYNLSFWSCSSSCCCFCVPWSGDRARAAQGVLYRGGAHRVRGPHLRRVQAGRRRDRLLPKVRNIGLCVLYYIVLLHVLYKLYCIDMYIPCILLLYRYYLQLLIV